MRQLPKGISNYEDIVAENRVYVDKTMYIEKMEDLADKTIMFLRPRKFGKTLFTSTLECYYDKNKADKFEELFGKTYIGGNPTPNKNRYCVLRFNFSGISTNTVEETIKGFREKVDIGINRFVTNYKLDFYNNPEMSTEGILGSTFEAFREQRRNEKFSKPLIYDEEFKKALADKQVPILVLDEKWHRLFAVHGKPDEIHETENELNALLARQGKLNEELKQLKKVKKQLMESIVANMDGTTSEDMDAQREKKLDEDKRLIDETNQKMEENEDELLEIPRRIRDVNRKLMLQSMGYFYEKIRVNKKESDDIDAWINQVRVDLKKNIIRKQNRDINNREIYAYLHDIFGPSTLDLFDIHYEDEDVEEDSAQNKQNDTKESQKEEES